MKDREALKKFYIEGEGVIDDSKLRTYLLVISQNYRVRVLPKVLQEDNKLEVIISGHEENIREFWEHIKKEYSSKCSNIIDKDTS